MFTDHMLFSGATELFGVLVMLYSFAMSIRVKSRNPILLYPTSCSRAHVARKNCDLFPAGRRTSANRKEETSC